MATRLIIARHGNTFAIQEIVRRVGITDLPLTEVGQQQGFLLGTYLQAQELIPDVIFTSKLQRTIQTAQKAQEAMGTNLSINRLSIFDEINYGPDENQPESEVVARLGDKALKAWEEQAIVPQGWLVDPREIINNWLAFSTHLYNDYAEKTCLVITSNGIARFAAHLTGDFEAFSSQHKIKIATGAFCHFEISRPNTVWNCLAWNKKPGDN